MKKILLTVLVLTLTMLMSCGVFTAKPKKPKNVILFIGDGMGLSHVTAGKYVKGKLNMERFKTAGFATTHSASDLVTGSGASGSALATGYKTYNGAISVTPDSIPKKTSLEYAEENGKATGLVVTCAITHATPAAFCSHVDSRKKYNLIAEQIVEHEIEVLFGGGWNDFVPDTVEGSRRKDSKNLLAVMEKRMQIVRTAAGFYKLDTLKSAAALLFPGHPPVDSARTVSLKEFTQKAIQILSNDKDGFFLMVEGSQIDWGGHDNDKDYIISEVIDFDEAVGAGLDFAEKNGETLIIVTADHETGGFGINNGSYEKKEITEAGFTTGHHTATMVPVFSYGPGKDAFSGITDNAEIGRNIIEFVRKKD